MKVDQTVNMEKNNQNAIVAAAAKEGSADATTALVATELNAVAISSGQPAYITQLLENLMADFMLANEGLDLDFVYMGSWLIFNKKGVFHEKDNPDVAYGDHIDVVIGQGEKHWSLWGLQDSPEDGQLIVACKEKADAEAALAVWLEANPDAATRYSMDDLELRYMAYVVPVASLGKGDEMPKIYIMSFAPTNTIAYGKYARALYMGNFKAMDIPQRTGVNKVVTRITTADKKGKNTSWIGLEFAAVGLFNPADYGIQEDAAQ